jgi:uncharacterized protein YgbK (DUF1537 family)
VSDSDLATVGAAAALQQLVTGGSGIALGLPDNYRRAGFLQAASSPVLPAANGRALVLAGSCSAATRAQITAVHDRWPTRKIDVDQIAAGTDIAAEVADWAEAQPPSSPVLIYASADPDEVAEVQQRHGVEAAGKMVESVMGSLAVRIAGRGFDRLVIAGGETSGAVVSALEIGALRIGPEIDPGVPWTETLGEPRLALALKSGNFGNEDFFARAFTMLE